MKVITEERLADIFATRFINEETQQLLINECQELDTLTVTSLRPMSEAQEGDILVKWIRENGLRGAFYVDGWVYVNGSNYKPEEFQGWIPIPKYEPGKGMNPGSDEALG